VEPWLSFITLGVEDLERASRFYANGLGLSQAKSPSGAAFFQLGQTRLALYPRELLAADAGLTPGVPGFANVALACNVASRAEVDRLLEAAAKAGGRITQPGRAMDWGGYAGYFTDLDGFAWEVAWNPRSGIGTSGIK